VEGKVAIITDGTPFASIVPATFFHLFHTSEDNALRWQYGTFIRFVRLLASIFATFLPAFSWR
jgi:spore germination protein KA